MLSHQLALESAWVVAEAVEASEFPELADQYQVSGVPHTSINHGEWEVIGAAPEGLLISEIKEMLAKRSQWKEKKESA